MGAQSGIQVGPRISDDESWPCEACGVRGHGVERNIWCSGTGGVRTKVCTCRVCPRCYRLMPHVLITAMYYRLRHDATMPQLEEWLAKETEPQFDLMGHILRNHGVVATNDQSEYVPNKIIVPVTA